MHTIKVQHKTTHQTAAICHVIMHMLLLRHGNPIQDEHSSNYHGISHGKQIHIGTYQEIFEKDFLIGVSYFGVSYSSK